MLRGHVFKFQTFANEVFAHFINTFLQKNMGITKGCELSNTSSSATISAGYFCVYGRFLEIVGTETISDITNTGYYRLVCEIDLAKINTKTELNQAEIKVIRGTSNYPTLTQEDLDNGGSLYQYEFAKFRVTENGISDFTDTRTFLNFESIYTQITNNFESLFEAKSDAADDLLQEIQDELDSIIDRSGLITRQGGTINGSLQVDGILKTDSLKDINGNSYHKPSDFAIIRGIIEMKPHTTNEIAIPFPEGFNKNNCVVVSAGLDKYDLGFFSFGTMFTTSGKSLAFEVDLESPKTNFQDNKIHVRTSLVNESEVDIAFNTSFIIVLMKIESNISGYELGDINMDGQVNTDDCDLLVGYLSGDNVFSDKQFKLADMNNDGRLNSADIAALINKIQGNN